MHSRAFAQTWLKSFNTALVKGPLISENGFFFSEESEKKLPVLKNKMWKAQEQNGPSGIAVLASTPIKTC